MAEKRYDNGLAQLYLADARDMSFIEDESVDLEIFSPPYWSLRKYGGGAELVWDAAEGCEHVWGMTTLERAQSSKTHWQHTAFKGEEPPFESVGLGQFCQLCGAWRGQLGLEPTIELYLDHLLQITDTECGRVLKPSGVMVVNMGDSYASSASMQQGRGGSPTSGVGGGDPTLGRQNRDGSGLRPLNLCMIPARFALAMQQRGWYLRSIVPWLKRASMPDSVQGDRWERCRVKVKSGKGAGNTHPSKHPGGLDRTITSPSGAYGDHVAQWADCPGCAKCIPNDGLVRRKGNWRPGSSMEWLFLFSKTNDYYSDAEGVRMGESRVVRSSFRGSDSYTEGRSFDNSANRVPPTRGQSTEAVGRNRRQSDWLYESLDAIIASHEREARRLKHLRDNGGLLWEDGEPLALLLNPKGYKEAHFATYPIAMVEPLIKAYTSDKGNCPKCGAPWVRVIDKRLEYLGEHGTKYSAPTDGSKPNFAVQARSVNQTLGWRPDCECDAGEPVPAVVCDPFVGSGTTNAAATKLGRRSIGVDIVPEYIALAIKRLGGPFTVETRKGVRVKQQGLFEEL